MSIRIEDGKGNGNLAEVTSNKKLRTYTTVESEASFESETNGRCFSWTVSYDYVAGDTVLLIKNTNQNEDLLIEEMILNCDTNTAIIVHCPECETPTGTANTGINVNRTSGKTASATAIQDETTNTQADVIYRVFAQANANSLLLNAHGTVVLGYNDCIAIDYVTEGGACYVTVVGYYHKID